MHLSFPIQHQQVPSRAREKCECLHFWKVISPPQEVDVCGLAQVKGVGEEVGKVSTGKGKGLQGESFVELLTRIYLEGKNFH